MPQSHTVLPNFGQRHSTRPTIEKLLLSLLRTADVFLYFFGDYLLPNDEPLLIWDLQRRRPDHASGPPHHFSDSKKEVIFPPAPMAMPTALHQEGLLRHSTKLLSLPLPPQMLPPQPNTATVPPTPASNAPPTSTRHRYCPSHCRLRCSPRARPPSPQRYSVRASLSFSPCLTNFTFSK